MVSKIIRTIYFCYFLHVMQEQAKNNPKNLWLLLKIVSMCLLCLVTSYLPSKLYPFIFCNVLIQWTNLCR